MRTVISATAPIKSPCPAPVALDLALLLKLEREVRYAHDYASICASTWTPTVERQVAGGIANRGAIAALARIPDRRTAPPAMRARLDRIYVELFRIASETHATLAVLAVAVATVTSIESRIRRTVRPVKRARFKAVHRAIRIFSAANEAV